LVLLDRLGTDFRFFGFHEEALLVAQAAALWAERQGDRYGMAHFHIKAAQCCVSLLDFRAATAFLAHVIPALRDKPLEDTAELLNAAEHIAMPNTNREDLRELRAELLFALAARWAATGQLGAADHALARVLAADTERPLIQVSCREVALRLAEIRLDRGDFAGYEHLGLQAQREQDPRWHVLDGAVRLLQGRFTEADACFKTALESTEPALAIADRHIAQWQRVHGLCALNRMDEAEEQLDGLVEDRSLSAEDLSLMRALIGARRASGPLDFGMPPSVRETLDPAPLEGPDKSLGQRESSALMPSQLRRTRERIRDEWASISNRIQLHLHSGEIEEALALFLPLEAWTMQIDSPLLSARLEYLWAVMAHYARDYGSAEVHSSEAMQRFHRLGMPQDEWAASRVNSWALERQHSPREQVETVQARAQHLLESIRGRLSETDRVTLSLNKWSVTEEQISQGCHTLRDQLTSLSEQTQRAGARRRKQHRLIEDFLVRLSIGRRWDVSPAPSSSPEDMRPTAERQSDMFSWTQAQIRLRRLAAGDPIPLHVRRFWFPSDTALLNYIVLPDRLELLLTTSVGSELISLRAKTSRVELWQLVRRALSRLQYDETWNVESLANLGRALGMEELSVALPESVRHLIIGPDNILVNVPFAVLPIGGRPLVERYTCSLQSRLRWVKSIPRRAKRYRKIVALGVTSSKAQADWPELPFAAKEIDALKELHADELIRFVDEEATTHNLIEILPGVEAAHLACHGEFRPEAPHSSGLLLHDTWLTVADVARMPACRLEFAMLGSCWGANASLLPGGEAIGLPTAFLSIGTKAVITSLWQVPDEASVEFTRQFYRETARIGGIGGLAAAQREACSRELPPKAWAGYVLYIPGIQPRWPFPWWIRFAEWVGRTWMLHR